MENSWGEDYGDTGYLVMTHSWFLQFVFEVGYGAGRMVYSSDLVATDRAVYSSVLLATWGRVSLQCSGQRFLLEFYSASCEIVLH